MSVFRPFDVFSAFRLGAARPTGILQPIALVSPVTGAVFVTADGKVLTRGVRRVKPQES